MSASGCRSGHLAWFVIDAVGEMDLEAFYAAYRVDGRSRPPYDPAMMVALLLYAYARGIRSSRVIERACEEDVAFRVLAAQQRPDHATIARFVERHQDAIAGLFGEVLTLCARSGLAKVGVIAVDGTKVQANASRNENLDYEQLAREILEEAKAVDAAEDELYGEARGDELPPEFATGAGPARVAARGQAAPGGRARARARSRCRAAARSVSRRPSGAWRRSSGPRCAPTAAYEAYRARGRMKDGRRFGRPTGPLPAAGDPEGRINVTDPDSRVVKGLRGFIQGYNAQAVTNEHQIVSPPRSMTVGAGLRAPGADARRRPARARRRRRHRHARGAARRRRLLAPASRWNAIVDRGIQVLIPPDTSRRRGARPRLGRRPLRLHAPRPRHRPRRRALPQTPADDRARVRARRSSTAASTASDDEDAAPSAPNGD